MYATAGIWNDAIRESKKAIMMAPSDWYAWYNLAWSHAAAGDSEEAVEAFHQTARFTEDNSATVNAGLAYAFARAGQRDSAVHYLEVAHGTKGVGVMGYDAALVRFVLGDTAEAFALLEQIFDQGADDLRRFELDPTTAEMRADPRYEEIASRYREQSRSR